VLGGGAALATDLWGMTEQQARDTLFPTAEAEVSRYRGRVKAWVAANEVTDEGGIRTTRGDASALVEDTIG